MNGPVELAVPRDRNGSFEPAIVPKRARRIGNIDDMILSLYSRGIPTGIGGMVLNYLLFVSRLLPRPIAVLGLVGYGLFSLAVPLDLLGALDMNQGTGMLVLVPGFLFEFVVLPIWLIAKGFTTPPRPTAVPSPALATVS